MHLSLSTTATTAAVSEPTTQEKCGSSEMSILPSDISGLSSSQVNDIAVGEEVE